MPLLVEWRDGEPGAAGLSHGRRAARPRQRVDVEPLLAGAPAADLPQLRLSMHVLVWSDLSVSVAQYDDVRIGQLAHGEASSPA